MFDSIKSALATDNESNKSGYADILKTPVGNTFTVRLLPFSKKPQNTFFHYFQHGWNSFATGQYTSALSLQTFGERDPIAEERYKILRTGSEEDKEKAKAIMRSEKWLVNVYVVNDPANPENNGKVKIFRYGKQIHNIIMDAIEGDDAADLGPRIFDLGPNGANFRIKVEKQGEYPTYVSSKFAMPSAIDGVTETNMQSIYDSVIDLTSVFTAKSPEDLKVMLDDHFYCNDGSSTDTSNSVSESYNSHSSVVQTSVPVPAPSSQNQTKEDEDEVLKELLAGIDL
tara:strand:- start:413 stop:1264 length:852 start_codon:yes stop_codon:yes gene_type:complete